MENYYLLIIPLLLVIYILLKKKPKDKKVALKTKIHIKENPPLNRSPLNGIVTYEDKIKGVYDSLSEPKGVRISYYKTRKPLLFL